MIHRRLLLIIPLVAAVVSLVATSGATANAAATATSNSPPPPFFGPTTCSGGAVVPGSYVRLTIQGNCSMPISKVVVLGDLTIANGASFDAISQAQLVVKGNVTVGDGAAFGLGCSPASTPMCSTPTDDRIRGTLTAVNALAVIVHSSAIFGAVSVAGGGGGLNCTKVPLFGMMSPAFTTFEQSVLNGGVTVDSMQSCWFGVLGNQIGNDVNITNNQFFNPDANEIASNTILGSLNCVNNMPHAQIGDSMGSINTVTRVKRGECTSV